MKQIAIMTSIASALALTVGALAQQSPGKSSDSVKEPPAKPPGTTEPARDPSTAQPGKSGDAVNEPSAAQTQREFKGEITSVNREEKTITIKDDKMGPHKLHIGETTKLKRGEAMASWDDLKVGTNVSGTCRGGKDAAHAETLTVGS